MGSRQISSPGRTPKTLPSDHDSAPLMRAVSPQEPATRVALDFSVSDTRASGLGRFSGLSARHGASPAEPDLPRGVSRLGDVLSAELPTVPAPATRSVAAESEESSDASPEYIENVIRDVSRELSDGAHLRANVTQAHRLRAQSGLSVNAFVEVLYTVRRTTRLQPDVKRPMPYFFKLVKVQLGLVPNPRKNQQPAAEEQSAPQRTSLAGKYAHLVHRWPDE